MDTRPDQTRTHAMIVEKIEKKDKTFFSKEGTRSKYVIWFAGGYKGEYCPLIGQEIPGLKENRPATFKIKYRKDFGDEIDIIAADAVEFSRQDANISTPPTSPTLPNGKVTNMHGHPAAIAVMAAKGLLPENATRKTSARKLLKDADIILEWLLFNA